jgi:hypothetical protein
MKFSIRWHNKKKTADLKVNNFFHERLFTLSVMHVQQSFTNSRGYIPEKNTAVYDTVVLRKIGSCSSQNANHMSYKIILY